jgi:uncharacterized protein YciI
MASFMVYALDKPDRGTARLTARDAHRARLREHDHPVRVRIGGPLLDNDGGMIGTMLVVEAESMDLVRRFVDQDPYARADVYANVAIHPFKRGLGNPSPEGA